jgi:hypothetical protein
MTEKKERLEIDPMFGPVVRTLDPLAKRSKKKTLFEVRFSFFYCVITIR